MACVHAATARASTTAKYLITLSSLQWLTIANNDGERRSVQSVSSRAEPFKPDDCSYVNLGGSCQLSLLKPSEKSGSLPQRITRKGQEAPTPCPRLLQSCLKDTGQGFV
jgi:hypothetical protein